MHTENLRAGLVGDLIRLEDAFRDLEHSERAARIYTHERGDMALASARYEVAPSEGAGHWELLRLGPDLFVVITSVQYCGRITIPVVGEDLIEFHFRLSGRLRISDRINNSIDVPNGALLIWRQPEGCDTIEHFNVDGERESSITIYFRPSFLDRCFGSCNSTMLAEELAAILGPASSGIRALQAAIYPALRELVLELAQPADRSGIRLVRAEALVIQIVSEVLTRVALQKHGQPSDCQLKSRDVECLRRARELLIAEHKPAPTIEALGKRVGLSPTKLKTGFRQFYGQTISEFAGELRMQAAKHLLRTGDKPISHVAAELGYEFQNSFTVAFRRRFGVLPKDYRKAPLVHDAGEIAGCEITDHPLAAEALGRRVQRSALATLPFAFRPPAETARPLP